MSLNDIELPAFIIQDLFQKTLVDLSGNEKKQTIPVNKELNFFGGNKQHILLLVNNPDTAFLLDEKNIIIHGDIADYKEKPEIVRTELLKRLLPVAPTNKEATKTQIIILLNQL